MTHLVLTSIHLVVLVLLFLLLAVLLGGGGVLLGTGNARLIEAGGLHALAVGYSLLGVLHVRVEQGLWYFVLKRKKGSFCMHHLII